MTTLNRGTRTEGGVRKVATRYVQKIKCKCGQDIILPKTMRILCPNCSEVIEGSGWYIAKVLEDMMLVDKLTTNDQLWWDGN